MRIRRSVDCWGVVRLQRVGLLWGMAWLGLEPDGEVDLGEGKILIFGERREITVGTDGVVYPCKLRVGKEGSARIIHAVVECRYCLQNADEDSFGDEVLNWGKVSGHKNVVELYGKKVLEGHDVFSALVVYECMEGNLGDIIGNQRSGWNCSKEDVLSILIQIGEGLHHVHKCGLIHMGLEPANVVISKSPSGRFVAKIANFRHSISARKGESPASSSERETTCYQAPEVSGSSNCGITPFSDVYSFGAVMCALYNLENPPEFDIKIDDDTTSIEMHDGVIKRPISCDAPFNVCKVIETCLRYNHPNDHSSGHGRPNVKTILKDFKNIRSRVQLAQESTVCQQEVHFSVDYSHHCFFACVQNL